MNDEEREALLMRENSSQAVRVMRRCDQLAACSDSQTNLTRLFLTPAMHDAHRMVSGWMREAGMTVRIDEMGNLIGHYAARAASDALSAASDAPDASQTPVLLLGSHLDTVPNAGKYDGILGVVLGIETVAALHGERLPFAVEVIGFSEEEGVRFKTPYLGSRAIAGSFDAAVLNLRDAGGTTMAQSLRDFGLEPDNWPRAACDASRVLGYLEAHIEQGPVLEERGVALGIVSDIAGQSRLQVRFSGEAGHAGTLPMHGRRDALTAASEWVLEVENRARRTLGLVATVGSLTVAPNTPNVVAAQVTCSLDVRHAQNSVRESAVAKLVAGAHAIAERRDVGFEILSRNAQPAVPMNDVMRRDLQRVCESLGVAAPTVVSGAGHDAAVLASLCPCAMLFLRTPGGASHSPLEAVLIQDVALALHAMHGFLLETARNGGE